LSEAVSSGNQGFGAFFTDFLGVVYVHKELFRSVIDAQSRRYTEKIENVLLPFLCVFDASPKAKSAQDKRFRAGFLISGCLSIIRYWLDDGCKLPIENVAALLNEAAGNDFYKDLIKR
jgi:hypothetical protein